MSRNTLALALGAAAMALAGPARAADSGDQLFHRYCAICHDTTPGKNKIGPSLAGVLGRTSGSEAGFDYSDAMKNAAITWDAATLDRYLGDPRGTVPGTKMLFTGIKNPADRAAIIDYLAHLKS